MLHRLKQWDALEQVAQRGLTLAQNHLAELGPESQSEGHRRCFLQRAQGHRLLADVALARSQAEAAKNQAEAALQALAERAPNLDSEAQGEQDNSLQLMLTYERSAAHFSLARALLALEQSEAGLAQLETARQVGDPKYDPPLYIQILRRLRTLHFDQENYLSAFEIKQQYRSIERQYGLRAFVGAGRLESQKAALRPGLTTTQKVQVSQEIAASGRQQDVERLIERMGRTDCKLTVIYGQSGVGKSSLVQAGFIPAISPLVMDARRITVVLQQVYTDWVTSLRQCFQKALKAADPHRALPSLETADDIVTTLRENSGRDLLTILVFDQFEEFFFIYKDVLQRKPFYDFLQQCLNIPFVKVVLSVREDYLHYLLECNRLENLEIINNNILDKEILYYLGNFSKQDTKRVIESLTGQTAFYLQPDLVEALVNDLAGELGEVRPIELQVVGAQLQTEQIKTLALYRERGPKAALVGRFLEEVVKDCGPEQEQITKLVLYLLTDENNTRPLKTRADLELELDVEGGKLDLVLKILVLSRLVFLIPATPADRYQLVHDYLVEFVRKEQSVQLVQEIEKEREMRRISETRLSKVMQQKLKTSRRLSLTLAALIALTSIFSTLALTTSFNIYASLLAYQGIEEGGIPELLLHLKSLKNLRRSIWKLPEVEDFVLLAAGVSWSDNHDSNYLESHTDDVIDISVDFENFLIASISKDRTIKLWDFDGHLIMTTGIQDTSFSSVLLDSSNQQIITVNQVHEIEFWNFRGKKIKKKNIGHKGDIYDMHISTDSKNLYSISKDNTIRIWNLINNKVTVIRHAGLKYAEVNLKENIIKTIDDKGDSKKWKPDGSLILQPSFQPNCNGLFDPDFILYESNDIIERNSENSIGVGVYEGNSKRIEIWNTSRKRFMELKDVKSSEFSNKSEMVATISQDYRGQTWTIKGELLKTYEDRTYHLKFIPNNNRLVSASFKNRIIIEKPSGDLESLTGFGSSIRFIRTDLDGESILSSNGKDIKLVSPIFPKGKYLNIRCKEHLSDLDISSNGELIAAATANLIQIFDRRGDLIGDIGVSDRRVDKVKFSPNNQLLASVHDYEVNLWQANGDFLTRIKHNDFVEKVVFSPDSKVIATLSRHASIAKLWKPNGDLISVLDGHSGQITDINFSQDSQLVITSSEDRSVKIWGKDGNLVRTLESHKDAVNSTSFYSENDPLIASASDDKTVLLWKTDGTLLSTLEGHTGEVYYVFFRSNGEEIVSIGRSSNEKLDNQALDIITWNKKGEILHKTKSYDIHYRKIDELKYDKYTLYGGVESTVKIQDETIFQYDGWINEISLSNNGELIAIAPDKGPVQLIERFNNGILSLHSHTDHVNSVSISMDSQLIASASDDRTIKIWKSDGQLLQTLQGHSQRVSSVAFSPDGEHIASISDDNTLRIWNQLGKKDPIRIDLPIQVRQVNSLRFNHNGSILGIGNGTRTSFIGLSGMFLKYKWLYGTFLEDVNFSPDGNYFAAIDYDELFVLPLNIQDLVITACDQVKDYIKHSPSLSRQDKHVCKESL